MTLREMSREYRASAAQLSAVLRSLRAQLRACQDPEERLRLQILLKARQLHAELEQNRE